MLVILTVVGLLLALLIPKLLASRESSHRIQCSNNLRRLGSAVNDFVAKNRHFPPSHSNYSLLNDSTWIARVLPQLDEQGLYDRYNFQLPWNHLANARVKNQDLSVLLCPASRHRENGQGDYAAIYGPREMPGLKKGWQAGRAYAAGIMIAVGGDTKNKPVKPSEVIDGLSKTLIIGEDAGRLDDSRFWLDPYQAFVQESRINSTRADELFSDHPGGAFVVFADGRVHFLPESTELDVIDALVTRARGEVVPDLLIVSGD
jgi:hypothetical protein